MNSISPRLYLIILFLALAVGSSSAQQPTPSPSDDTITGRVINEAGQGISGASISLDVLGSNMRLRTNSDSDGVFKIVGLDSGVYRLYVSAPGYVTQSPNSSSPTYRPGDKAELTMIKGAVISGS